MDCVPLITSHKLCKHLKMVNPSTQSAKWLLFYHQEWVWCTNQSGFKKWLLDRPAYPVDRSNWYIYPAYTWLDTPSWKPEILKLLAIAHHSAVGIIRALYIWTLQGRWDPWLYPSLAEGIKTFNRFILTCLYFETASYMAAELSKG